MARVRMSDVAARAGVSTATVSMVLNGVNATRISPQTQQRVQAQRDPRLPSSTRAVSCSTGHGRKLGAILPEALDRRHPRGLASSSTTRPLPWPPPPEESPSSRSRSPEWRWPVPSRRAR